MESQSLSPIEQQPCARPTLLNLKPMRRYRWIRAGYTARLSMLCWWPVWIHLLSSKPDFPKMGLMVLFMLPFSRLRRRFEIGCFVVLQTALFVILQPFAWTLRGAILWYAVFGILGAIMYPPLSRWGFMDITEANLQPIASGKTAVELPERAL